jgi:hypothetical protein
MAHPLLVRAWSSGAPTIESAHARELMRSSPGIADNLTAQARIRSFQEYHDGHSYRALRSDVRHAWRR